MSIVSFVSFISLEMFVPIHSEGGELLLRPVDLLTLLIDYHWLAKSRVVVFVERRNPQLSRHSASVAMAAVALPRQRVPEERTGPVCV